MKATITRIVPTGDFDYNGTQYYSYDVYYNGTKGQYVSTSGSQNKFVEGEEAEFTEEVKVDKKGNKFVKIKPVQAQTGYGGGGGKSYAAKVPVNEKGKYPSFAVSYCKDLIVAKLVPLNEFEVWSERIYNQLIKLESK